MPHRGQEVQICVFALEKEMPCTYQKEKKLAQKEIQE